MKSNKIKITNIQKQAMTKNTLMKTTTKQKQNKTQQQKQSNYFNK